MSPVKKENTPYVPPPMSESESGYEWLSGNVLSSPSTVMLNVTTVMVVVSIQNGIETVKSSDIHHESFTLKCVLLFQISC